VTVRAAGPARGTAGGAAGGHSGRAAEDVAVGERVEGRGVLVRQGIPSGAGLGMAQQWSGEPA
jgi:hypothetical protein